MNLNLLSENVITLVKEVGGFIRTEFQNFSQDKIEYKGLNDLVSYVDKTAETTLVKGLVELLPESGFITEEKTINKTGEVYNWIIDPLDGTTNFIHGIPTFAISIALKQNDELVFGVVYEINRDEFFTAIKGEGAYLNQKKIQVSKAETVADTLLATGFPYYDFTLQEAYLGVFKELMQKSHGLRRIGSAAVDLAYVAAGRFDGFFEYNLHSWDVAAGILLVQEAGGEVIDFTGGDKAIERRELLATNSKITSEILEIIQKYFSVN
jgi:myo-inositol-1(or 4)-monophosphatase